MTDPEPKRETTMTALTRSLSPADLAQAQKNLRERTSTKGAELELKRLDLAAIATFVEGTISEIMDDKSTLNAEEREKKANGATLHAMVGIIRGLEYIGDCLTKRKTHKMPDGERGFSRLAIAEMFQDLNTYYDEEGGILDTQRMMFFMMNDIGVALKAFKDENGVDAPTKYMRMHEAHDAEAEEPLAEDHEAVRESTVEKLKKKK